MALLLGVDGGNTKTVALIARSDGVVLGAGRAGCADIYGAESPQAALAAIAGAVETAIADAHVDPADVVSAAFSLAGADWPEDFDFLRAELSQHPWAPRITVVNDAIGPLRAGSAAGPAVSVVCGTALAIGAHGLHGELWHASWWLEGIGSGSLAHAALRAVYRAELAIEPPTSLTQRVLDYFGMPSVPQVLHLLTARDQEPRRPHGLAAAVLDEADAGDCAARRIVIEQATRAGEYAAATAKRMGLCTARFPLIFAGGVFRHPSTLFPDTIAQRVQLSAPGAYPFRCPLEPAAGALLLAFDLAGIQVNRDILANLRSVGSR